MNQKQAKPDVSNSTISRRFNYNGSEVCHQYLHNPIDIIPKCQTLLVCKIDELLLLHDTTSFKVIPCSVLLINLWVYTAEPICL